jgi:ribosome biogenesis GTPase / thiamine phosphate phosphatase
VRVGGAGRSVRLTVNDRPQLTDLPPARVLRVDRGIVLARAGAEVLRASLGSDLLDRIARDPMAAPCTGDWCVLRRWPDGPVTVEQVCPRRHTLVRADVKGSSRGQVLAANVDLIGVVVGLLPDPAMGRLERLLAVAWASGARPVVVLTKAEQVPDAELIASDVRAVAPGVPVVVSSAVTGLGIDALRDLVGARTIALVGASGAGKSSLVNALVGGDVLAAKEIRPDGRGRHTSVRRELVMLPSGGAVIDTPGLRGVGLLEAEEGLAAAFDDIRSLAEQCRFRDCTHQAEPGCAVVAAVEDGRLSVRRVESWRRLRSESARITQRQAERRRRSPS